MVIANSARFTGFTFDRLAKRSPYSTSFLLRKPPSHNIVCGGLRSPLSVCKQGRSIGSLSANMEKWVQYVSITTCILESHVMKIYDWEVI